VFAGYRIDRVLDRGGMGVVYVATDADLDRRIALKVIAPEHTRDPTAVARFKAEARLAAALEHPNIVPVYRGGEHDGVLYLAMRLVAGTDLRRVIDGRPLELPAVARIVSQIASALDAAHERGLVHRDVKPANILLTGDRGDEQVYLTDFGLTKRLGSTSGLTRAGGWVGTPDYLAPEQIRGEALDGRADVYALGCVVHEMLTGRPPYAADTQMAKLWAHVTSPPPRPREHRADLVARFDDVVATATAKDPDDRYATAGGLVAALQDAIAQQGDPGSRDVPSASVPDVAAVAPAAPGGPTADHAAHEPDGLASAPGDSATIGPPPEPPPVVPGSPSSSDGPARTRPRARRGLVWAIGVVLVVLAGIGVTLAVSRGGPAPAGRAHTESHVPASTRTAPTHAATSFVVAGPQGVAVGAGAVWVTTRRGTLTRIDPGSGARTSVDVGPRPDGVVVAFGSVWVSVSGADRVARVSAGEHPRVLASVKVGSRPEGIFASPRALWVANAGDGTLSQIIASTGAVRTVPRVAREPVALTVGAGAVWVAARADGTLARVDGGKDRLTATIRGIGARPDAVAFVGRNVFVATAGDGRVWRVNGDAEVITGSARVGGRPRAIASDGRRLWVADQARNELIEIDPETMRVAGRQPAPGGPIAVAVDGNAVWVAGVDAGQITRIHG
jgi:serine/threonine protein kinase/DNA-binding beta-propeller fold protein YncE